MILLSCAQLSPATFIREKCCCSGKHRYKSNPFRSCDLAHYIPLLRNPALNKCCRWRGISPKVLLSTSVAPRAAPGCSRSTTGRPSARRTRQRCESNPGVSLSLCSTVGRNEQCRSRGPCDGPGGAPLLPPGPPRPQVVRGVPRRRCRWTLPPGRRRNPRCVPSYYQPAHAR